MSEMSQRKIFPPPPIRWPQRVQPVTGQVVMRAAKSLTIHALAAKMPMLDVDAPERETLRESVELHGLDRQPLLINERDEIMDGRHRREEAVKVGLVEVPCIVLRDDEAASIIVESLFARRHYTKGARAYLAAPVMKAAAKANADARVRELRKGRNLRNPAEQGYGKTEKAFAEMFSLGLDTIQQAKALHELFEESDKRQRAWKQKVKDEGMPEHLAALDGPEDLRARFEPQILNGDKGLGAVRQSIASILSTKGQPKATTSHAQLLFDGWDTAITRVARWEKFAPDERETFLAMLPTLAKKLPREVREAWARELLAGL